MFKRALCSVGVALLIVFASVPTSAQVCAPLDNGHIADAAYQGTVIYWDPVVEFERMVLTISGPCEDIVETFDSKDQIMFDIRDIERVVDGQYTWTLKRTATVDKGVAKNLKEARFSGNEQEIWWAFFQAGKIPNGPYTESGHFTVDRGQIIDPASGSEKVATISETGSRANGLADASVAAGFSAAGGSEGGGNTLGTKASVLTSSDGVIRNSLCVGFDCPNSPSFSDSTILLMENNTRIKFDDTSTSASFPRNDWEVKANDTANGGASYLAFVDCGDSSQGGCADDELFVVEAGARGNALYVESDGDIGIGTANPVVRLHMTDGDTPAMRLEQDGSSGFSPQTWDVAGNETSFFIRDATNGSALPFRIRPGASSNRLVIDSDGDIGIGVLSPDSNLNIVQTNATSGLHLERAGNPVTMLFEDSTAGQTWEFKINAGGAFAVNDPSVAGGEFILTTGGDLTISGDYFSSTCTSPGSPCAPDYVFAPDYELMPLDELKGFLADNRHLPNVPSEDDLRAAGQINMSKFQLTLLEKIEELTLYTLDQEDRLGALADQVRAKDEQIEALREAVESLTGE